MNVVIELTEEQVIALFEGRGQEICCELADAVIDRVRTTVVGVVNDNDD